jgi:hypothetical protein
MEKGKEERDIENKISLRTKNKIKLAGHPVKVSHTTVCYTLPSLIIY